MRRWGRSGLPHSNYRSNPMTEWSVSDLVGFRALMRKINLKSERAFENLKARGAEVRSAQGKSYWATEIPILRHKALICDNIKGKSVLEIGYASGKDADDYCRYAARYIGVNISNEAIANCEALNLSAALFHC